MTLSKCIFVSFLVIILSEADNAGIFHQGDFVHSMYFLLVLWHADACQSFSLDRVKKECQAFIYSELIKDLSHGFDVTKSDVSIILNRTTPLVVSVKSLLR